MVIPLTDIDEDEFKLKEVYQLTQTSSSLQTGLLGMIREHTIGE